MPDAGPGYDEDGGQRRPDDQAHFAGQVHPAGHGSARRVREYRKSRGDRVGNAIFSVLARAGIGPAHLLTTRGRKTGRLCVGLPPGLVGRWGGGRIGLAA